MLNNNHSGFYVSKERRCMACDMELVSYSILVCAECLEDDCSKLIKMAEELDTDEALPKPLE